MVCAPVMCKRKLISGLNDVGNMHPNDKTSGLKKTFKKKCISPLHKSYHKSTFEPFGQGILSAVMTCRISCRGFFPFCSIFLGMGVGHYRTGAKFLIWD